MSSNRLSAKPYRHILFLMLAFGSALRLHAAAPGDGTSPAGVSAAQESRTAATPVPEGQSLQAVPDGNATVIRTLPKRAQHLAPRDRPQHTFFANAAYTAVISTLYLAESSSGSLNEGYDISAGYNWTSRRGFGAGIVYSGGFISAERNGIRRTSRIHYIAPGADGSSGKARASATAATSAATAIRRAAGAASASMNRPPWSSCWDATSAWARGSAGNG